MSAPRVELIGRSLVPPWPGGGLPQIAIAGRSNVGKSSLVNRLLGRKDVAAVGKSPGKTKGLHFYAVDDAFVLVDLPGYGYAKVSKDLRGLWGRAISDYVREAGALVGVIVLLDGRLDPPSPLDLQLMQWLDQIGRIWMPVYTKADKVGRGKRGAIAASLRRAAGRPDLDPLWTSSVTDEGVEELWAQIRDRALNPDADEDDA